MIPHRIRSIRESDYGFVVYNWSESLHSECPIHSNISWAAMKRTILPQLRASLEHDMALVACDPNDDDRLLGFIVTRPTSEGHVLLYGWVRNRLRGHGVGLGLLLEAEARRGPIRYYAVRTKEGRKWAKWRSWEMLAPTRAA